MLLVGALALLNTWGEKIQNKEDGSTDDGDGFLESVLPENRGSGTQPTPDTGSENAPGEQSSYSDSGAVGAMNHEYLQGSAATRLIVEVDHTTDTPPNDSARSQLISTINQYSNKPTGVVTSGANSFPAPKNSYTNQDIQNLIREHRSNYSSGDTATLYILYLNGSYAGNENALGLAFNASTFVVFKDRINAATTALVFAGEIERAVLVHELGHLWGLVNINYESEIDHEDKNRPNHSNNRSSVMYWAVEDVSVANVLSGGPPYRFDSADEADITKIRNGEY